MKLKSGISILLSFLFVLTANATLTPVRLTCEYLVDPSVIDARHPRLSWINTAAPGERGQQQTAYQIRVASSADKLKKNRPTFGTVVRKKQPVLSGSLRRKAATIETGMLVASPCLGCQRKNIGLE